jgi:hypothetical protein
MKADVEVNDQGSIVLVTPMSEAATDWIAENVQDGATYWGPSLVVEHRFADDLIAGMQSDGLEVA